MQFLRWCFWYMIFGTIVIGIGLLWAKYIRHADIDEWIKHDDGFLEKIVDILKSVLLWPIIFVGLTLVSFKMLFDIFRGN